MVTGRLFKASGRAAFLGYLVGFIFTWFGVIIGVIMLAKGPPKKPFKHLGIPPNEAQGGRFPAPPNYPQSPYG